jgi:predicted  nucleic acid-binding Zn-ribbon protein
MNKIKHMGQLGAEKKRLQQQENQLERKISNSWKELKDKLRPQTMAKEALGKWMDNKTEANANDGSIFSSILSYGASLLAKKFSTKAEQKFQTFFRKKD